MFATIRIALLLLTPALVFGQGIAGADRTLLAEGDYVIQTKYGSKPQSHWKLCRLSNSEYEVVDGSTKDASAVQIFRFDADFLPTGYTKKFGPPPRQVPDARAILGWTVSCEYMERELRCETESSDGRVGPF